MKCNLLPMVMVVAAAPVFAQAMPLNVGAPELSTISLIAAGIVALGLARRKTVK